MAVTSTFTPSAGILSTFGDSLNNNITVSRDAAGKLLVNGGAVKVLGGTPTVANTSLIQVFGQAGNDTITGGSGSDMLFGQADNDTLLGKGGADFLFGGAGNDVLTGGDGDDQMFGEAGNDRMIWNPGDDSDLMEGGDGVDTAEVNGGNGAENFTLTANGSRVRFDRVDPAPFSLDIGTTENIVVNMNGGDDVFTAGNGLATLIQLTVDGGRGNDTALLGAGDDTFVWNPGDGSDTVEGQAGTDTLLFNGANIAENIDISANGDRVRFSRDIATITMDLDGVEKIAFKALGGADTINVHNLSGTDAKEVAIDLGQAGGGGDGQIDTVVIDATSGDDVITFSNQNGVITVHGLGADVTIRNFEANDRIVINGLAGDDVVDGSGLTGMLLTAHGGDGADVLIGSTGDDVLTGDEGDDVLIGNGGLDVLDGGPGDNIVLQGLVAQHAEHLA